MGDCPVDKLCIHIIFHQDFLRRAWLFLTPRYITRGLLLHHVEDLSGNVYDMFMHEFASLPTCVRGAAAGTCHVCLPLSGCFSSYRTLLVFMENLKLLDSLFSTGKSP